VTVNVYVLAPPAESVTAFRAALGATESIRCPENPDLM
jgi:hypothetical protein